MSPRAVGIAPDAGSRTGPNVAIRRLNQSEDTAQSRIIDGSLFDTMELDGRGRGTKEAFVGSGPDVAVAVDQNRPEVLSVETIGGREPVNALRLRIEAADAVGVGPKPDGAVGRGLNGVDRDGSGRLHNGPRPSPVNVPSAEKTGFTAYPHSAVGARQNFVDGFAA